MEVRKMGQCVKSIVLRPSKCNQVNVWLKHRVINERTAVTVLPWSVSNSICARLHVHLSANNKWKHVGSFRKPLSILF